MLQGYDGIFYCTCEKAIGGLPQSGGFALSPASTLNPQVTFFLPHVVTFKTFALQKALCPLWISECAGQGGSNGGGQG